MNGNAKDIGILVVHGIGEQKRVETVTSVVSNFYQSLNALGVGNITRDIRFDNPSYPATLLFSHKGTSYVIRFYEAYWADLDQPYNFLRWLKLIWWALTIWVRHYYDPPPAGMRTISVGKLKIALTRIGLFFLSILFLVLLSTLRVLNQVSVVVFKKQLPLGQTLYNFLGDVQLFVSEDVRFDTLETLGRRSRYAIRTRLWNVLARANLDPIQELYILAHSLGTVIAFNVLMETAGTIAGYIDDRDLIAKLQQKGFINAQGNADRGKFLSKIAAVFTLGSPLDKFAAIWPRVIPVNLSDPKNGQKPIPWINVHDILDVVGANLNHFKNIPGLTEPTNIPWQDQPIFATAHTSYWKHKERRNRFIDRFVDYVLDSTPISQRKFTPPQNRQLLAWAGLFLLGFLGIVLSIYLVVAVGLAGLTSVKGYDLGISDILLWFTYLLP